MGEKRKFDKKKTEQKKRLPRETFEFVGNRMFFWRDEKKIAIPTETKIKTKKNLVS